MIRSMTGYARAQRETDFGALTWELRTVNHRYLETHFRLPEEFRAIESRLRGLASTRLGRGIHQTANQFLVDWMKLGVKDKPVWSHDCKTSAAVAICANAVVIAEESKIVAVNVDDGGVLWSQSLPAAPVEWGLAIDKEGRAVVTLTDGRILCFGAGGQI